MCRCVCGCVVRRVSCVVCRETDTKRGVWMDGRGSKTKEKRKERTIQRQGPNQKPKQTGTAGGRRAARGGGEAEVQEGGMVNTFIRDSAAAAQRCPNRPVPCASPSRKQPSAICTACNWPKRAQELVERATLPSAIWNRNRVPSFFTHRWLATPANPGFPFFFTTETLLQ